MKIGVFDSGKGGRLIADRLMQLLPGNEWMVVDDLEHVPYGEKDKTTIIKLTDTAIQSLLVDCPIIVIACNTATTAAITELRERHPATLFVGVEPMIKPAATESTNHHISLLATPYTLQSDRYQSLKTEYGAQVVIDEPDTTGWAKRIDEGQKDSIDLGELDKNIDAGSDTIVLACTHYLDLIDLLATRFPAVAIIEPSLALARQIERLSSTLRVAE